MTTIRGALWAAAVAALAGAAGCDLGNGAQASCWAARAPLPGPRVNHALVALGGHLYAIGGSSDSNAAIARVDRYDPATDAWTRVADLLSARMGFAAGVVNGKIYVACGTSAWATSVTTTEEYDPATDTWTNRAPCPLAGNVVGAAANGRLYAFSGGTLSAYDPITDTWTAGATFYGFYGGVTSAAELGGALYLATGPTSIHWYAGDFVRYDPIGDVWTSLPTRDGVMSATLVGHGGAVYAIGGEDDAQTYAGQTRYAVPDVHRYDPATAAWTYAGKLGQGRIFAAAAELGAVVYVAGGSPHAAYGSPVPLDSMETTANPWCPPVEFPPVTFP